MALLSNHAWPSYSSLSKSGHSHSTPLFSWPGYIRALWLWLINLVMICLWQLPTSVAPVWKKKKKVNENNHRAPAALGPSRAVHQFSIAPLRTAFFLTALSLREFCCYVCFICKLFADFDGLFWAKWIEGYENITYPTVLESIWIHRGALKICLISKFISGQ